VQFLIIFGPPCSPTSTNLDDVFFMRNPFTTDGPKKRILVVLVM